MLSRQEKQVQLIKSVISDWLVSKQEDEDDYNVSISFTDTGLDEGWRIHQELNRCFYELFPS